jgi:hypothetical protein
MKKKLDASKVFLDAIPKLRYKALVASTPMYYYVGCCYAVGRVIDKEMGLDSASWYWINLDEVEAERNRISKLFADIMGAKTRRNREKFWFGACEEKNYDTRVLALCFAATVAKDFEEQS